MTAKSAHSLHRVLLNAPFRAALAVSAALPLFSACGSGEPPLRSAHTAPVEAPVPCASSCVDELLVAVRPEVDGPLESPVSLTTSDGAGLELTQYDASVVVEGPLAFTQLRLTFRNPERRVREGRFTVRLPAHAAISRFATHGPIGWQEAEVVERKRAQLIYEDYLHRRVDPALMENSAGNEFSARVFPIAAGEDKHIIVSFSSELEGDGYSLPLAGLPRVSRFAAEVRVTDPDKPTRRVELRETDYQPRADLAVPISPDAIAVHDGRLALLRVKPDLDVRAASMANLTVLVDTSASRMLNLQGDVRRLRALLSHLAAAGHDVPLTVLAFDQEVAPVFAGRVSQFDDASATKILQRKALGASDLARALAALKGEPRDRVLLVSDVIATAGEVDGLMARVKGLDSTIGRLDVLLSGGLRDEGVAQELARGVAKRRGIVSELAQPSKLLSSKLQRRTFDVDARVAGATWVYPATLEGVQPGDSRLLYVALGRVDPRNFDLQLSADGKSNTTHVGAIEVHSPLLSRAAASAQIRRLTAELSESPRDADTLRSQIVDLSRRYRVLSNQTALLVLESDADYARYGLRRDALADILTIGPSGIELMSRTSGDAAVAKDDTARPPRPKPEARSRGAMKLKKRVAMSREFDAEEDQKAMGSAEAPMVPEPAPEPTEAAPEPAQRVMGERKSASARTRVALDEAPPPARSPSVAPPPSPAAAPPHWEDSAERLSEEEAVDDSADRVAGSGRAPRASRSRPASRRQTRGSSQLGGRFELPYEQSGRTLGGFDVTGPAAHDGTYAEVQRLLANKQPKRALEVAWRWLADQPGDALALFALGEAYEALGELGLAARAYGSVIDLFPARTDLRRFAATRLDHLSDEGHWLAIDSFQKARAQRPDHLTGYRLESYALVKQGRYEEALDVLLGAFDSDSRIRRAAQGSSVLRHDVGLIAAAWLRAAPGSAAQIKRQVAGVAPVARKSSLSFVLSWETDANDVDLHVLDGRGGHAFYSERHLPSGGALLEDVTRGYGPELFAIEGVARGYPYELGVHYYSRGPMGYGMGRVEVIRHDGHGKLTFETRPFVIMSDHAKLSLGEVVESSGAKGTPLRAAR